MRLGTHPHQINPRILAGLSATELHRLLSAAKHRRFPASSVIVHQGDPAERFFLLTSGQGRHFVLTPTGKRVLLHWLTAGQIIGGAALISSPFRYVASAELVSDGCTLVWNRHTVREFAVRHPKLLDNALSIAATEYIAWSIAAQVSLSSDDAWGRVAHLLTSLSCGVGRITSAGIELQISNEELAAGANVSSFTVSRALSDWQLAGVLVKQRGKIVLKRPEQLMAARGTL